MSEKRNKKKIASSNYVRLNLKKKGTYKKRTMCRNNSKWKKRKHATMLQKTHHDVIEKAFQSSCYVEKRDFLEEMYDEESNTDSEIEITEEINLGCVENTKYTDQNSPLMVLKRIFKYDSFREGQEWAIKRVLEGNSTLLVQATGYGKSLTYQLPSFILPGMTIVVSPLISLMSDQLLKLPAQLPGACLSGQSLSLTSAAKVLDDILMGKVKILYLSPERLCSPSFKKLVSNRIKHFPAVSLLCIDEAHCLSRWSHNFRPSYLRLKSEASIFNPKCILALTATACSSVIRELCDALNIPASGVHLGSWKRSNLNLNINIVSTDNEKRRNLCTLLKEPIYFNSSCIVYVWNQRSTELIAEYLICNNFKAAAFHGGMCLDKRSKIQKQFSSKKVNIIVATVAFGLGVDISHIRGVIHYDIPQSLEEYVQQIGRAGRDGKTSHCHLFLRNEDYVARHSQAHSTRMCFVQIYSFLNQVFLSQRHFKAYPRVAIDIDKLQNRIDLKVEVIDTLLALLEDSSFNLLTLKGKYYENIKVTFRKKKSKTITKSNIMIQAIESYGTCDSPANEYSARTYSFCVLELSAHIDGFSPSDIFENLEYLQRAGEIEFHCSDKCQHAVIKEQSPLNLKDLAQQLLDRMNRIQEREVFRVEMLYQVLSLSTLKAVEQKEEKMCDVNNSEIVNKRKCTKYIFDFVEEYFEEKLVENGISLPSHLSPFQSLNPKIIKDIQNSFKVLMLHPLLYGCNKDKSDWNGSKQADHAWLLQDSNCAKFIAARIFHGISSHCFPYKEWHSNVFWNMFKEIKFEDVLEALESVPLENQL